jgi:hypothetical protein
MRFASESKPSDAIPMNVAPSTSPTSTGCGAPFAITSQAASASSGMPVTRAKSLPRPPGSTPITAPG